MIEDFFKKRIYLSLYCTFCVWEGVERQNRTAVYWPPLLWPSALCLSRSPGLLNRRPGGSLCWIWLSLPHLVTNGSPNSIGGPEGPFCWVMAFSTTSYSNFSGPQFTDLHVWSSSSGNNCHAVHRSLSSGASVYECTMGFYLVRYCQQSPPTYAISSHNCHRNVSLPSGTSLWNGMFGRVEG